MGVLPEALEILFEVQMKRSNEKVIRKKKVSKLTRCIFFLFEPILLSNLITFLFFINFEQYKIL
jgi:hypothetical protein